MSRSGLPIVYVAADASVAVIQCSPPSWMVRIALEEKQVAYELVSLAFDRGEHRSPKMLALNPRGTVPVLEHGDTVVHETYAILDYLEDAFPQRPLLPGELAARAAVLTRYHEAAALKTAGMALFAAMMRGAPSDQLVAPRDRFAAELAIWSAYVPEEGGLVDGFSLADVVVVPYLATAAYLGIGLPPPLQTYLDRMRCRASIAATWPQTWAQAS